MMCCSWYLCFEQMSAPSQSILKDSKWLLSQPVHLVLSKTSWRPLERELYCKALVQPQVQVHWERILLKNVQYTDQICLFLSLERNDSSWSCCVTSARWYRLGTWHWDNSGSHSHGTNRSRIMCSGGHCGWINAWTPRIGHTWEWGLVWRLWKVWTHERGFELLINFA